MLRRSCFAIPTLRSAGRSCFQVPKDQELALQWAKRAADQGSPYGRKLLGELRTKYSGTETAKDLYERAGELDKRDEFPAAADLYARAVELEAPYSGYAAGGLGYLYMSGKGVTQDYNASIRMFRKQLELAKDRWWAYTSLSFAYRKYQPGGFEAGARAPLSSQERVLLCPGQLAQSGRRRACSRTDIASLLLT